MWPFMDKLLCSPRVSCVLLLRFPMVSGSNNISVKKNPKSQNQYGQLSWLDAITYTAYFTAPFTSILYNCPKIQYHEASKLYSYDIKTCPMKPLRDICMMQLFGRDWQPTSILCQDQDIFCTVLIARCCDAGPSSQGLLQEREKIFCYSLWRSSDYD